VKYGDDGSGEMLLNQKFRNHLCKLLRRFTVTSHTACYCENLLSNFQVFTSVAYVGIPAAADPSLLLLHVYTSNPDCDPLCLLSALTLLVPEPGSVGHS
jgi:hypothetical protein